MSTWPMSSDRTSGLAVLRGNGSLLRKIGEREVRALDPGRAEREGQRGGRLIGTTVGKADGGQAGCALRPVAVRSQRRSPACGSIQYDRASVEIDGQGVGRGENEVEAQLLSTRDVGEDRRVARASHGQHRAGREDAEVVDR